MKGRSVKVESWRNTKHNRIVMRRSFRAFNAGKKGVGWRAKEARDVAGLWMGRSIRVESWKSMKHGRIVWGGMLEPSNAGKKKALGAKCKERKNEAKKWFRNRKMRPKIHPKILKIAPKEVQNPSKRVKNRFKTHFGRQEVKNKLFCAIFAIFFRFLEAPEPPKTRPKFQKTKKNRSKIIVEKKNIFKDVF